MPACCKVCVNNTIYIKIGVLHKMLVVGYLTEYCVGRVPSREEREERRVVEIGDSRTCTDEELI